MIRASSALATSSVVGRCVLENLRLGVGDRVRRGEEPEVRVADVGPHADVRLGDADQRADFAGVIHAQLDDRDVRLVPQLEQRERQADVVVEIPLVPEHAVPRAQELRRHFLRRGLAGAAGDRHDSARRRRRRTSRATSCSATVVSVDADEHRAVRRAIAAARLTSSGQRVDQHSRRAACERVGDELVAVEPLAANGDEEVARGQRPRVDRDAARSSSPDSPCTISPAGRGRHVARGQRDRFHALRHPRPGRRRRPARSCATSTSSNGSTRSPITCVLLVTLAGDEHQIARAARRAIACSIAALRSTIARHGVDAAAAALSARDRPASRCRA